MFSSPVDCTTASQSQSIGVAKGGGRATPPIEMLPMIKVSQKILLFFSFFSFLRVQQYMHTTVINNNIDSRGLGPLNLIFANQFKWAPYNNI